MNKQMARTLLSAAAIGATVFELAGCAGGSGAGVSGASTTPKTASSSAHQFGSRPTLDRGGQIAWRPDHRPSWMSPDAAKQTLLYVSDIGTAAVQVFAYPKGTLVGTLTGFGYPQGECSDADGNVFIGDAANDNITEYAHGGTTPVTIYDDAGNYPASCAIDPTTGNLAVANLLTAQNFEAGSIAIYPKGSTSATTYTDPVITREYFLAFDPSGNVFVAGVSGQTGAFVYSEMTPNGTFTHIPIKGGSLGLPGGVQLAGGNMAVIDQQGSVVGKPDLYQITPSGKVVGKTTLRNATGGRLIDPVQFVFSSKGKKSVTITADAIGGPVYLNALPNGAYNASYTTNLVQPLGVALSSAPN